MKKNKHKTWILVEDKMPEVTKHDDGDYSNAVLILDINNCVWLARWDGEVWRNANTSDKIYFNKTYIEKWVEIPK